MRNDTALVFWLGEAFGLLLAAAIVGFAGDPPMGFALAVVGTASALIVALLAGRKK